MEVTGLFHVAIKTNDLDATTDPLVLRSRPARPALTSSGRPMPQTIGDGDPRSS